ncbi:MAG: DUF2318 domain-containing protein [Syntrophales bacterium]|nr:DUF2318 domain-containing protein [Syntrophales bacterium]
MKKILLSVVAVSIVALFSFQFTADAFFSPSVKSLSPKNGSLMLPISQFDDGKAHYFTVKADDGILVTFFALKSRDGVIRTAIDACDVCYRAGKGYSQEGDYMICGNCGMSFSSERINVAKGGCNPAPLIRTIKDGNLVISMNDINTNSWYCKYKKQ